MAGFTPVILLRGCFTYITFLEYRFNIFHFYDINWNINQIALRYFRSVFPYYNVSFLQKTAEMEIKLVVSDQIKPFSSLDENDYFIA